jgi:hypothetical protein
MGTAMQNRKDLLQAHRLMTQRAALALLCGEPDSPNQPLRRLNVAAIAGVLTAAITAAVIAVIGYLAPGTVTVSGLTKPGMLVIDKDTATAYVPCENGKLCPALNYASALLALDTDPVDQVAVSQASITRYPIGPVIGISGLPADLPLAASLVKGPWSVCVDEMTSVLVGGVPISGRPLGAGNAVLATDPQGAEWVIWHGERLLIGVRVAAALFGDTQPVQVPDAWLDALPQGPGFAAPAIDGQGAAAVPTLSGGAGALCVSYGAGMSRVVTTGAAVPGGAVTTGASAGQLVDQVWLPDGHGALVGAVTGTDDAPQTYFLVVGGMRYALSAPDVAAVLGYDLADDATMLPASVLDLLPQGPVLDPATASRQA